MMRLWILLALFITIELVIGGPLSASDVLKRRNHRNLAWNFDDVLKGNNVNKREKVIYNKYGEPTSAGKRAVVLKSTQFWPEGFIYYDMSNMQPEDQQIIQQSMQMIMEDTGTKSDEGYYSCINFVPRRSQDKTYITFQYGAYGVCNADVGYYPGRINKVTLGETCINYNTVQHELMHVIGFYHEQNSPFRDDYIEIFAGNVEPSLLHNFKKFDPNDVVDLNIPYDINSIMQYPGKVFLKPGATGPSIVSLDENNPLPDHIDVNKRLSTSDVQAVQLVYNCPA